MKGKHFATLLASLFTLLVIVGLLIIPRNPPESNVGIHTPPSEPAEAEGYSGAKQKANEDTPVTAGENNTVAPATQQVPWAVESIERGPNNRMIYARPSEVVRNPIRGKLFAESFLSVRRQSKVAGKLTLNEHTLSAVEAVYNPEAVNRFISSDAELLTFPLDLDQAVQLKIERVLSRGEKTQTFIGKAEGNPTSAVTLVFHDGAVSGSVAFLDENVHYQVASAGNGDIAIRKLDVDSFDEGCGMPGPELEQASRDETSEAGDIEQKIESDPSGDPQAEGVPAEDGGEESDALVTLDMVVGYGAEARIAEGGVAAMEALIIVAVDRMNTSFINSGVTDTEAVLMATIEDPDYIFPGDVSGSMGSLDELGRLRETSDGVFDTVTDLRRALGADHCTMVLKQTDGSAGVAYRPGDTMMVSRTYMTSVRLTFAHEFGHSLGCHHAWGDTGSATNLHNYGWRLDPPASERVRTIMAYDWGWGSGARIQHFSNPAVQYQGANTGAVNGYDATGDATADPRAVSGGLDGNSGSGYDGTNSALGARNGPYILANAPNLEDNSTRTVPVSGPEISIEYPSETTLTDASSSIDFGVTSAGLATARTIVIINQGDAALSGITATFDGAHPGDFTVSTAAAPSLESLDITRLVIHFSPTGTGTRTANLHILSNDSNEGSFDIALSGNGVTPLNTFSEDFDPGIDTSLWADFSNSMLANTNGQAAGSGSTGNSLWFGGSDYRYATTMPIDTSAGGNVTFKVAVSGSGSFPWDKVESGEDIVLEYSTDGVNFTQIGDSYDNTTWQTKTVAIPLVARTPATQFRFRQFGIRGNSFDHGAIEDLVIGLPANTITLFQPNGGDVVPLGSVTAINWGATIAGNVRIELHKAGVFHSVLSSSEPNDGAYSWNVSESLPAASDYRIRVSSVNNPSIEDFSDADFSIFQEAFPPAGSIPQGWITSSGANAGWEVNSDEAFEGNLSLRNTDITHNQTASIEYTDSFSAGNVGFRVKVSSESSYDFFRFYIDGTLQGSALSGNVDWTAQTYPVTAGSHTFRWSYSKDSSADSGSDSAWIDLVTLPPAVLPEPEITVQEPVGTNLTDGASTTDFGLVLGGNTFGKTYTVRNEGPGNLTGLAVTIDGPDAARFTKSDPPITTLGPGQSTTFQVTFSPAAQTTYSANLHVLSNDVDEASFDISLTGTGGSFPSLSSLSMSTGTLAPGFSTEVSSYIGTVASSVGNISITATSSNPTETLDLRIGGGSFTPLTSGIPSSPLALGSSNLIEVRVTSSDGAHNQIYEITINPGKQTIDFPAIGTLLSNAASFPLNATTASGLPVTYSVLAGGNIASISGGSLTLSGTTGPVTILASQAGNGDFQPAEDVYETFYVSPPDSPVVEIAIGRDAKVIRKADGTIWAAGWNGLGTLGDGSSVDAADLQQIGTDNDWAAISTGSQHVLALKENGSLWSWGYNYDGQVGDGSRTLRRDPVQTGTDTDWESIAGGDDVSLAIKTDGSLWAWGENQYYQLGNGSNIDSNVPVQVGSATDWEKIAAGDRHVLAVKSNGTLWSWGDNVSGSLGNGNNFTDHTIPTQIGTDTNWATVSAGYQHSLALKTNGTLWAWGEGFSGRLGDGSNNDRYFPGQIGSDTNWTEVAAGFLHSIGMKSDGSIWQWGDNLYGQMGSTTSADILVPTQFGSETDWTVIPQSLSNSFLNVVAKSNGMLWTWGGNSGTHPWGKINPVPVLTDIDTVTAGDDHSLAIRNDGTLWAWGVNYNGKLGDGTQTNRKSPFQIGTANNWRSASAGDHHSIAVKTDNTLWAWGDASQGQLGSGSTSDRLTPTQIGSNDWDHADTGDDHTVAIKTNGTLWAWGDNIYGQVGDGTTTDKLSPVQIGSSSNWVKAAAGDRVSLAIRTDGTLWVWGDNIYSQLGDGTNVDQFTPQQVGIDIDWQQVVAGTNHVLAIKTNGTLWGWGNNSSGRLGDGTFSIRRSPIRIGTGSNWSSIYAGLHHSMGLKNDGTLWAWGDNGPSRLGDGTYNDQLRPVQIGSDNVWSKLAGGGSSQSDLSFTVDQQGILWGWGDNGQRLLGENSIEVRVPRVVHPITEQTITASNFVLPSVGNSVALNATASSGLPVDFFVSGPASIDGNLLTVNGVGNVVVTAYQPGDQVWDSAWPVPMNGDSILTDLTISEGTLEPVFDSQEFAYDVSVSFSKVSLTVTPVTSDAGAVVEVQINGGGFQVVNSEAASHPLAIAPGSNLIDVKVTASNGASYRFYRVTVERPLAPEEQTIDFSQVDSLFTSNGPITLDATASSGLPVSFEIVGGSNVASISGNILTLSGTPGAVTIRATQPGNGDYSGAEGIYSTFRVIPGAPFEMISSKHGASSGIRTDGSLWAWGANTHGELGDGTTIQRASMIQVGIDTDWQTVAKGMRHSLALKDNGTLWAWGENADGRLGDGTQTDRLSPVQIGTDTDWQMLAPGDTFSVALKSDGTLWAWGSNSNGQLGDGTTIQYTSPQQIGTDSDWQSLAAGDDHSLAIKSNGTLWSWGVNTYGQLGDGTVTNRNLPMQIGTDSNWQMVSAGNNHSVAIKNSGALWAWGRNEQLQVGDGTSTDRYSPVQIGTDTDWVEISAGGWHNQARKSDNTIWAWGSNSSGRLGDGTQEYRSSPTQVGAGTNWLQVSAGGWHSTGLADDGIVRSWGLSNFQQLGQGIRMPAPATLSQNLDKVSSGNGFVLAIQQDGSLQAWGGNYSGQFGNGTDVSKRLPVQIGFDTDWDSVSAGFRHSLGIRTDNTLWAWGENSAGLLISGSSDDQLTPFPIGSDSDWATVRAGYDYSFAIKSNGTLWGWGENSVGQLGLGTNSDQSTLTQIGTDSDWSTVSPGHFHSGAIKSNGTLWTWGNNQNGRLGDGTTTARNSPVQIGSNTNWSKISMGFEHSVGLQTDGTLWAWGDNADGQLGDGTTINRNIPIQIGSATDWQDIAAGESFTLGLRMNGTLWTWGKNLFGQFGNGSDIGSLLPKQVGTGRFWTHIPSFSSGRQTHALAFSNDGTLWGWGNNHNGQLSQAGTQFTIPLPAISPEPQTIEFPPFTMPAVNGSVTLAATASSGLPVQYLVSGPASISGDQLTVAGAGLVEVIAYQPGDHVWNSTGPAVSGGNADLLDLSINAGGILPLTPGFESSLTSYAADIATTSNDTITVTPILDNTNANAQVRVNGGSYAAVASGTASLPLPVVVGQNILEILVTAENGTTTRLYSIELTRPAPSSDADLSGLTLNGHTFEPNFDSNISNYSAFIPRATSSVTLIPISSDIGASIEVRSNGGSFTPAVSGATSPPLPVQEGDNTIEVRVTAEDGVTTGIYRVATSVGGQFINFADIGSQITDSEPFDLMATASSGLPVTYSITAGGHIASISGNTLTIGSNVGPVTVRASQDGNGNYLPASDAYISFYVNPEEADPEILEIAMGRHFSVLRKSNDTIWSAGFNGVNNLGDGTTIDRRDYKQIGTGTDWTSISSGSSHTIALQNDNTLWSWGLNASGRLGDGTTVTRTTPVQIGEDSNWKTIAAGDDFSIGIRFDGTLWSWGENAYFQLGQGNTIDRSTPTQVGTDTDWHKIAAGDRHALAIKANGTLWSWGDNPYGQLGNGSTADHTVPTQVGVDTDWQSISAGYFHSLALKNNGGLWAWGRNNLGQLGLGNNAPTNLSPTQVGSDTNWTAIAAGYVHSMARRSNGSIWVWGDNEYGQMGNPSLTSQNAPIQLGTDSNWTLIPRSMPVSYYNLALRNNGILWSWGGNDLPRPWGKINPVPFLTEVSKVSLGDDHTAAIRNDGTLWTWGKNTNGKLGDGSAIDRQEPARIGTDSNWSEIAAGDLHTLGLKSNGTLWAWGNDNLGQLGNGGDFADKNSPVQVGNDTDWAAIQNGDDHSVALKTNGTLWAWGHNLFGQVGNGTTLNLATPVQIGSDSDWDKISAGDRHTLAIKSNGTLWSWGDNDAGQLGHGNTVDQLSPIQVGTDTDWSSVSAGDRQSLAVKSDGTLWAWGSNSLGRLGTGVASISEYSPVQVGTDTDWADVAASYAHSLGLKTDGSLWGWGSNTQSRLGDGTYEDRYTPVQIGSSNAWSTLPIGGTSLTDLSVALTAEGILWGWGDNGERLLGDASADVRILREMHPITIQTITFPNIPLPSSYGNSISLNATASSGLPVTYVLSSEVATLDGNQLTINGPGPITLYAYQEGNTIWDAAGPIESFFIAPEIAVEQPAGIDLTDGSSSIDSGDVAIGENAVRSYLIRNDGDDQLTGLAVTVDGSHSAEFVAEALSSTSLAPGGSMAFDVTFTPTALGARTAELHIASSDLNENPFDISLTGNGVSPEIGIEEPVGTDLTDGASETDFESVISGQTAQKTYTIRNSGTSALRNIAVTIDGLNASQFSFSPPGASTLLPREDTSFTVTFSPSGGGERVANLHVASDDIDENPFDISLTGIALEPEIAIENGGTPLQDGVSELDYGDLISDTAPAPITLTIRNIGDAPLTGLSASVSGTNAALFGASTFGTTSLLPNESTTIEVTLNPTALGNVEGTLAIASNDADENPFEIDLQGFVIEQTSLQGWAESFGLTGAELLDTADDDGDFVSLIEEYAYNLDPTVADGHLLTPGTGTNGSANVRLVGDKLEAEFVARRSDPNLIYEVQFGDTPSDIDMQTASEPEQISPLSEQFERRKFVDTETTTTKSARFCRVQVLLNLP